MPIHARLAYKVLGGAAAATLAAGALTALGPTAEAATPQAPHGSSQTVLVIPAGGHVTTSVGSARVGVVGAPTATATCTLTVTTPFRYYGGPYGGGEEGLASIQCNLAVTQLFIEVGLFRNGTQVTYNSKNNYSNSFINVDTEYPVSAGSYYTGADGTQYSNGTSSSVPYATSPTVYLQ